MSKIAEFLKGAAEKVRAAFLTAFGDVKVFRWPMFLVYDPSDYEVDGGAAEDVLGLLEPGDVLIRGYSHYLDGYFIPNKSGETWNGKNAGGGWSQGAVYVGNGTVIHAVAEGVSEIHVLDFLDCDRVAVFRPGAGARAACRKAKALVGTPYDFSFSDANGALYCFELVAECYPELGLKTFRESRLLGLLSKDVYLAQSLFDCEKLRLLYVHNPASGIARTRFRARKA